MGKSIHGMRARSRDRARAHHNGRVSSRLFLAGCSPAEPASASPADATLRLHLPQCQRNFIERDFVTVLVVSAQGSTATKGRTAAPRTANHVRPNTKNINMNRKKNLPQLRRKDGKQLPMNTNGCSRRRGRSRR